MADRGLTGLSHTGPIVFLSYAHDDESHKSTVLELASFLEARGIAVELDMWKTESRLDWYAWALREIENAKFVILVASPKYRQVGDGAEPGDTNRGVQAEAAVLRDLLYRDREKWLRKVLPVVLPGRSVDELPTFVQPYTTSHFVVAAITDAGVEDLLRALTGQPRFVRPARGRLPELPAEPTPTSRVREFTSPSDTSCTLPADTAAFVGREAELSDLTADCVTTGKAGRVVVCAIHGMPGVGKTTVAVRAGHLLAARFPNRQLFVALHGHTPGQHPADPHDVLGMLLAADGVDVRYLPDTVQARAALWRDRMVGKRALLVLDDAADSQQVVPLLPGASDCLVIVTSRRYLGDLPGTVRTIWLDALPAAEAATLFLGLSRRVAEPAEVGELVALCGHLPLAISILAGLFTKHRFWQITDLISESRARLLTMKAESRSVAASFDLSYQHLPADRQRFFRYLGLHPGVDIDPVAAAALTGIDVAEAAEHLEALLSDQLLAEPVRHRYSMHDLVRDYTRSLAEAELADLRAAAVERLLDHCQHVAQQADSHLRGQARAGAPDGHARLAPTGWDQTRAREWLTAEHSNLLACIDHAITHNLHARVVGLTAAISTYLFVEGPWSRGIDLNNAAVNSARQIGDQAGCADGLRNIGILRYLTGNYPEATAALEQALGYYRDIGNRVGEADALAELGTVSRLKSDYARAAQWMKQALPIYRGLDDQFGRAKAVEELARINYLAGDPAIAESQLVLALQLYRTIDDALGQAHVLRELGIVHWLLADYPGAIRWLEQAAAAHQDLRDRLGRAQTYKELGRVRSLLGDYPGAQQVLGQALIIYQELGNRLGQAHALREIGRIRSLTGDYPTADHLLNDALDTYRELGNRLGEVHSLKELGRLRYLTRDYSSGGQLLQRAVEQCRELDNRLVLSDVLNHIGALNLAAGEQRQALSNYQHALELVREVRSPLQEARALDGIGKCVPDASSLRRALEIYRQLGFTEAAQAAE